MTARSRRPTTEAMIRTPGENGRRVSLVIRPARPEVSIAIRPRNRYQALEERVLLGNAPELKPVVHDDRGRRYHPVARAELRVLGEVRFANLELGELNLRFVDHAEDQSPGLLALPSAWCSEDLDSQHHLWLATSSRSGIST